MKHLITAFVAVVFVVLGGVAGHFLKSSGAPAEAAVAKTEGGHGGEDSAKHGSGDGNEKKPKEEKKSKKGESHGKGSGSASGAATYHKFSREFVVPMIENGKVVSLVILNINLEVDPAYSGQVFSMEPAIRDNIMTTLINISNDGRTFETLTDIESYESMRALVLMNVKKVMPNGISNILILDMARQDI